MQLKTQLVFPSEFLHCSSDVGLLE